MGHVKCNSVVDSKCAYGKVVYEECCTLPLLFPDGMWLQGTGYIGMCACAHGFYLRNEDRLRACYGLMAGGVETGIGREARYSASRQQCCLFDI